MIKYELKMIFRNRICMLMFATIAVFVILLSYLAMESHEFIDKKGRRSESINMVRQLTNDKNRWKGELTPDIIKKILNKQRKSKKKYSNEMIAFGKEKQSYSDIILFANKLFYGEHADLYDSLAIAKENHKLINRIYYKYRCNFETESKEYGKNKAGREFIMKKFEEIRVPVKYEAYEVWKSLFKYIEVLGSLLLTISAFISAKLFTKEFQYKSASIFFSTLLGRGKGIKSKILANLIVLTLLYWSGIGLLYLLHFVMMGIGGGRVMLQFESPYALYIVTYSQLCGISALCAYVASLLSASIAMFIAGKTREMVVAFMTPIILFLLIPFLVNSIGVRNAFITLLPHNLIDITTCSNSPYIYIVAGTVFRQIPFILLIYLAIAILLIPIAYRYYRNTTVNK